MDSDETTDEDENIELPLDFRTKVLNQFMPDGQLKWWPSKFKKQYIIIEAISKQFEPGRDYPEREVDAMLKDIYPTDHCMLRRYLVELRFVHRKDGVYRR